MAKIEITVAGIKKSLKRYDPPKAIAEFIWNGFDAGATNVSIQYEDNGIGGLKNLVIEDNGYGIPYDKLDEKFTPFFESEKEIDPDIYRKSSAVHGKNGVGRLTFFKFASQATWETTYQDENGKKQQYAIEVDIDSLNDYRIASPVKPSTRSTGTVVTFEKILDITAYDFETNLLTELIKEFCWFLELNKERSFSITINGNSIDYLGIVGDSDSLSLEIDEILFDIRYVRWNAKLKNEYSHYYFIGSDEKERWKKTTTLNNKGDQFFHSVFIRSDYFDQISSISIVQDDSQEQPELFALDKTNKTFRELMLKVDDYLRGKRRPFLKASADVLIETYEREGVFPSINGNEWDQLRHSMLENFVKELYQIQPRIFSSLNLEQKKTFVHLLNLIMSEGERDSLLEVLNHVIELDQSELDDLARVLRSSKLSGVIKTIKLIEDRVSAIDDLQQLVFCKELNANEPNHIQKMVENHYWLFGEQYHLVTAAEPKFEEALRRHTYLLTGESKPELTIDHPDKRKEMDIFMVRQLIGSNEIDNIVVELKNPKISLGSKQLEQVKKYMQVILDTDEFNGNNMTWKFYLIGNKLNTAYFEAEYANARNHGEQSLVFAYNNYRIYVKTWSEIFTDFELRHNFLLNRLNLERNRLARDEQLTADEIIDKQKDNTARQRPQIQLPD